MADKRVKEAKNP